jgi:hypothetical protein
MAILAAILIGFMIFVMYIHENKRGTKLWRFINKHIITDEDEYLKNK